MAIMILARGSHSLDVGGRDLLPVVKAPYEIAFEIALHQFNGFLMRRTISAGAHDNAIRKYARGAAGGIVEAVPSLHDVAVHVDHDYCLRSQWRKHRVAVPCLVRIVDSRARWVDRLDRRCQRGSQYKHRRNT